MDTEASDPGRSITPDDLLHARRTLTSVCHDLNNPLSIIAGNAQLLSEIASSLHLGEEFRDSIRDIEKAVEKVSRQLDRLSELEHRLSGGTER